MKSNKIFFALSVILLLLPVYSPSSLAKEIYYPNNQVERPLTLPDGVWEFGAGLEYLQGGKGINYSLRPFFSLRYGISNNLELYPFGFKYRLLPGNDQFELAIKGGITGFGSSSIDGTLLLSEIGLETKQRLDSHLAILYKLEAVNVYRSKSDDGNEIRLSMGGLIAFADNLAFLLNGTYRKLWGFDKKDATEVTTVFYYNASSVFDLFLEGKFSSYSENTREKFPSRNFEQLYRVGLNWRF